MCHRLVLLACVLVASVLAPASAAQAAACAPPSDEMTLWRQGKLRGANIWQGRNDDGTLGDGGMPTQADLDKLAAHGANYLQLSVAGVYTERPPYVVDEVVHARVDRILEMARAARLYVVIAFRTGPGRNEHAFRYQDNPQPYEAIWHDQAAQDAWAAMLRWSVQYWGWDPTVIGFSPMVEPNAVHHHGYPSPDEWFAEHRNKIHDWNRLAKRITTSVRQVDTTTPLLVEPESWASIEWLPYVVPTGDARTVYTVHNYSPHIYTHQGAGGTVAYPGWMNVDGTRVYVDRAWLDRRYQTVRNFKANRDLPVAVTEFGVHRFVRGATAFLRDQIDIVQGIGAGWALWEYRPSVQAYDDWDVLRGANAANHSADVPSVLGDVVTRRWAQMCARPNAAATVTDLALTVTDSPDPAAPGGVITYKARVRNIGSQAARGVRLTARASPHLATLGLGAAGGPAGWHCAAGSAGPGVDYWCVKPLLAAGADVTFTLQGRVKPGVTGVTVTTPMSITTATRQSASGNDSVAVSTAVS